MDLRAQLDIPYTKAAALGAETVGIIDAGWYRAPSGRRVEIAEAIARSVRETVSYPPDKPVSVAATSRYPTRVDVVNQTTLHGVRDLMAMSHAPAALNFASATSPGGGFLDGARAQEEYLARSTTLYACLRDQPMYAFHRAQRDPFYTDYVIYSPGVLVVRDDDSRLLEEPYPCAILTCPAVHAGGVMHWMPERRDEIEPVMRRRIAKVLATALRHGHSAIVLGAWGCGAFGNDGTLIAGMFRDALEGELRGAFEYVRFAITDWSGARQFIGPFEQALSDGA